MSSDRGELYTHFPFHVVEIFDELLKYEICEFQCLGCDFCRKYLKYLRKIGKCEDGPFESDTHGPYVLLRGFLVNSNRHPGVRDSLKLILQLILVAKGLARG
jgi:hypothetical protein